jgi:hypothetical protein
MVAVVATLLVPIAASLGMNASADTSGSPDTNTLAAIAPTVANLPAPSTIAGAVEGTTVNLHVDGSAGKMFGVTAARLCRTGLNITQSAQMSPSSFGDCIPAPFTAGTDNDFVSASASPTNTSVDFQFRVGTGSQTFSYAGGTSTITCDATHPCAIWLWESVDTTINATGNIFKHFDVTYAGQPGAPGAVSAPGNTSLTVTVTAPVNTGNAAITSYSVTATGPGGGTQTITPPATQTTFTGLTNFTAYTITATAQNTAADGSHFTSAVTTVGPDGTTTPVPPAPGTPNVQAGDQSVDLNWTAPSGPAVSSYDVEATPVTPAGAPFVQNTGSATASYHFTGLTNGTVYTFRVRGVYSGTPGAYSAASNAVTPNGRLITQTITVTRPQGALVLTQVCGAHGAVTTGTAPTFSGGPDPLFPQYPYPVDVNGDPTANYPTDCGLALGKAQLITSGAGAGQFFQATGVLNQVTVVDARDTDPGFTVNGQMGTFTSATDHFSGSELGWTPIKTSDTAAFTDSDGNTYDQIVTAGPVVAPNSPNATGLSNLSVLGSAIAGQGLGIGVLDANLKLWIPITKKAGDYTGVLTITAV